jgi:hypothetical protein
VGNNTYYILQREGQKKRYGLSMYTKHGGKELSDHTKSFKSCVLWWRARNIPAHGYIITMKNELIH